MAYQGALPPGVTQAQADAWLASHPGDEGRLYSAFSNSPGGGGSNPGPYTTGAGFQGAGQLSAAVGAGIAGATAPGGAPGGVSGTPAAGSASGAMDGLNKVVDPGATSVGDPMSALGAGGGYGGSGAGGSSVLNSGNTQLRALGRRNYPQESAALAGLREVY